MDYKHLLLATAAVTAISASAAQAQDAPATSTVPVSGPAAPISASAGEPASEAASPPSMAGRAAPAPNGDIIVTARRRAEDVSKVPISVSAFSGATLERKSILNTQDLTKITPGLNIVGAGSLANPFISIRGESRGLAGPGSPGVITYFNEVPLPTYGSLIPTFDMDNIQVLKGPQGTLFGRNAIGGALLTYSKKPSYDFGGYAEAEYGRFNELRLEGAVNLPIVQDKLAVRVAAQDFSTDGFTRTFVYSPAVFVAPFTSQPGSRSDNHRSYDEYNNKGFRASVLFEPTDNIHNITVVDYFRTSGENNSVFTGLYPGASPIYALPPATLTALGLGGVFNSTFHCGTSPSCDIGLAVAAAQKNGPRTAYTDEPPESKTTIFGVSNTTTIDIGDNNAFKNIVGYRTTKTTQGADIDGSALPIVDTTNQVRLQQITEEAQLSGNVLDDKLKYVVGGFYFKSSPDGLGGFQGLNIDVFNGLNDSTTANYLTEESKAVYGQADYDLSRFIRGLGVTAGYRYTWDRASGCAYSADYSIINGGTPPLPSTFGFLPTEKQCKSGNFTPDPNASPGQTIAQNISEKSKKGTYTFSVNWQATSALLLYATTRRGYRAGGFNSPVLNASVADLQSFKPETLTDVEIGAKGKYRVGGTTGTFDIALFRGKDKGYQYYQNTTGVGVLPSSGILINKANLIIKGIEADGTISPITGLILGANVAYTKISVDKITIPASIIAAFTAAGVSTAGLQDISVPNQPKFQANANVDYTLPTKVFGADLRFSADFHYQTKYASGELYVEKYHTVDARLTLAGLYDGAIDFSLFARNLFDQTYQIGTESSSSGTGAVSYIYAAPRTFGATLRYRFGQ